MFVIRVSVLWVLMVSGRLEHSRVVVRGWVPAARRSVRIALTRVDGTIRGPPIHIAPTVVALAQGRRQHGILGRLERRDGVG